MTATVPEQEVLSLLFMGKLRPDTAPSLQDLKGPRGSSQGNTCPSGFLGSRVHESTPLRISMLRNSLPFSYWAWHPNSRRWPRVSSHILPPLLISTKEILIHPLKPISSTRHHHLSLTQDRVPLNLYSRPRDTAIWQINVTCKRGHVVVAYFLRKYVASIPCRWCNSNKVGKISSGYCNLRVLVAGGRVWTTPLMSWWL